MTLIPRIETQGIGDINDGVRPSEGRNSEIILSSGEAMELKGISLKVVEQYIMRKKLGMRSSWDMKAWRAGKEREIT